MDLDVLVVGRTREEANSLLSTLAPDIQFQNTDFSNSMLKAIEAFGESNFSVCLVSDAFPVEELVVFFGDISKMPQSQQCVFVQVKDDVPDGLPRDGLKELGFNTIISRRGTHSDKSALKSALSQCFHAKEVQKRTIDIDGVMELLLKEVDTAAEAIRRGRGHKKLMAIPRDLVDLHLEFDEEVIKGYYKSLEDHTATSKPVKVKKLSMSEKVMNRKLPGLRQDSYYGASHRVWRKLTKKHGKKEPEE